MTATLGSEAAPKRSIWQRLFPSPTGSDKSVLPAIVAMVRLLPKASKPLTAWKGMTLGSVVYEPIDGVTTISMTPPAGPEMADTLTFVYWSPPDASNPLKNVAEVREGASAFELRSYKRPKLGKPVQLWIVVADADGHMTAPQKIL